MLPGIGKFESGNISGGGFEVVIGVGSFQDVRDQMLAMYRQHHIAPRGIHVINKKQVPGAAELPEGGEVTMELRQQIAAARAAAGYTPLPIGAKAEDVGPDLRENEAYLDGIVAEPDFNAITAGLVERMVPMTVVMPRELECPSKEVAQKVNREFWNRFANDPAECIDIMRGFAAAYVPSSSKLLAFWPPEVQDSVSTRIPFTLSDGSAAEAVLEHHVLRRTITLSALNERGMTLRNWFATTLCAELIEILDTKLYAAVQAHGSGYDVIPANVKPSHIDDIVKTLKRSMRGDSGPVAWLRDATAQEIMGLVPGQYVENIPGAQAICDDAAPFQPGFLLARSACPGLHLELPDAFEVEIDVDRDSKDTFEITLSYWHALSVDHTAFGFALFMFGE